jgi:hypothetical protein
MITKKEGYIGEEKLKSLGGLALEGLIDNASLRFLGNHGRLFHLLRDYILTSTATSFLRRKGRVQGGL